MIRIRLRPELPCISAYSVKWDHPSRELSPNSARHSQRRMHIRKEGRGIRLNLRHDEAGTSIDTGGGIIETCNEWA